MDALSLPASPIESTLIARPPAPAARPLAPFHALILALCRETRHFPAADPVELGPTLRGAALDAAEAVQTACSPATSHSAVAGVTGIAAHGLPALALAERRLRELSFCLEVARRLGYLSDVGAKQVMPLLGRAHAEVPRLAALVTPRPYTIRPCRDISAGAERGGEARRRAPGASRQGATPAPRHPARPCRPPGPARRPVAGISPRHG
jgi:hypothetical protein